MKRLLPNQRAWLMCLIAGSIAAAVTGWILLRPRYIYVWKAGEAASVQINTADEDYEPNVSSDGKHLIITRGKAGKNADLYISDITPQGLTKAQPLESINTQYDEIDGMMGADGSLYFYSDRPGGMGGYDLWRAPVQEDNTFAAAVNLGPNINSSFNDYDPCISMDGQSFYFSSNRHSGGSEQDYDLYVSYKEGGRWTPPKALETLNSPLNEWEPALSSDGRTLFFTSNRTLGRGGYDLYGTRFSEETGWDIPRGLGEGINTKAHELDPFLSPGGECLYYVSNRKGGVGSYDIWLGKQKAQKHGSLAGKMVKFLPGRLLLISAALIGGVILLWFLIYYWNRLSTLQKCGLGSIAAHCILVYIFTVTTMHAEFDKLTQKEASYIVYTDLPENISRDSVMKAVLKDTTKIEVSEAPMQAEQMEMVEAEAEEQNNVIERQVSLPSPEITREQKKTDTFSELSQIPRQAEEISETVTKTEHQLPEQAETSMQVSQKPVTQPDPEITKPSQPDTALHKPSPGLSTETPQAGPKASEVSEITRRDDAPEPIGRETGEIREHRPEQTPRPPGMKTASALNSGSLRAPRMTFNPNPSYAAHMKPGVYGSGNTPVPERKPGASSGTPSAPGRLEHIAENVETPGSGTMGVITQALPGPSAPSGRRGTMAALPGAESPSGLYALSFPAKGSPVPSPGQGKPVLISARTGVKKAVPSRLSEPGQKGPEAYTSALNTGPGPALPSQPRASAGSRSAPVPGLASFRAHAPQPKPAAGPTPGKTAKPSRGPRTAPKERTAKIVWGDPRNLGPLINSAQEDYEPNICGDDTILLLTRGKAGTNADIFMCTREGDAWSKPKNLKQINSTSDDIDGRISRDGSRILFYSNRSGGKGGYDIYLSTKDKDGTWKTPVNPGNNINSKHNDYDPYLSSDGKKLFFSSNRGSGSENNYDLYCSDYLGEGKFGPAQKLPFNTGFNEWEPALSQDGLSLYFTSNRRGGEGGYDIWVSHLTNGTWQKPANLGPGINTKDNELDPCLNQEGTVLYFATDRKGGRGSFDIWQVRRTLSE